MTYLLEDTQIGSGRGEIPTQDCLTLTRRSLLILHSCAHAGPAADHLTGSLETPSLRREIAPDTILSPHCTATRTCQELSSENS